MRTAIITLLAIVLCIATAHAQKQPAAVTNAFFKSYPHAKGVEWNTEDGKYEASFRQNGKQMSVSYNGDGTVDETEMAIDISELPEKALAYASAKGKVKEASKIISADGIIQYEAEVKKTDFIFDSQGNFIKETTKNEDTD